MEFRHLRFGVEISIHLPAIMTLIVALPFNQVFEVVIPHSTIQNGFDFVLLFTIDECQQRGRGRTMAWDWVGEGDGQFYHREDRVKTSKLWGES
jgi:hypothetical protein